MAKRPKAIRFQKQSVKGLAEHVLEWHIATYGGLFFHVVRRPEAHRYWPGPGVRATVCLGESAESAESPYYYSARNIEDGKQWCRGALCYILKGIVPFGDHVGEINAT